MEIIEKIIAVGLVGTVLSLTLKKDSPIFSLMIAIMAGISVFFIASDMLFYAVESIKSLFAKTSLDGELTESVLKISAVGIISEYFCSVIKDAGEEGLSKKIELGAKSVIFVMTLPIVTQVIEKIFNL